MVNAARNAYFAPIQTGMSAHEAILVEMETYKMVLRLALGIPQ